MILHSVDTEEMVSVDSVSPQFCRVNAEELAVRTDSSNVIYVLLTLTGVCSCHVRVWHCLSVEVLVRRKMLSGCLYSMK